MPTRLLFLTAVLLLTLAAPAGAVIVPNKGMAGVELRDCQETVIKKIGYPDRTFGYQDATGEFVSAYTYVGPALRLEFHRGPGECLELTYIRTRKADERTPEGIGKGSTRKELRAKLKGEKCRAYRRPKRLRICWLGKMTAAKPITEFRIDSKGRVNNVIVRYVID